MKQKYFLRIALVFFITIYSKDIKSQILVENFDNDSQFVKSENFFTDSTGDYFGIYDPVGDTDDFDGDPTSFGGIPNYSNYSFNYLIGEDLDAAGGSSTRTLTWSNLNITAPKEVIINGILCFTQIAKSSFKRSIQTKNKYYLKN